MLEIFICVGLAILALIILYYLYYKIFVCQKPEIHTTNENLKLFLNNVQSLKEKYNPPLLFYGGQFQTLWGVSKRLVTKNLPYEREIFELRDGGAVALDYLGDEKIPNRPLILFLPGVTSSSRTTYVQTLVSALFKSCDVLVFNNRGLGGVPYRTGRSFCGSNTEDLKEVIDHMKIKYAGRTLIAVGTSFGGIQLNKYLTTENDVPFKIALLISIMWDCKRGAESLDKPFFNRYIINKEMMRQLIRLCEKMATTLSKHPPFLKMDLIRKCKTVNDFDRVVTAVQFGFKSEFEYYETTVCDITKYTIPVIAFSADDDPLQPGELLPIKEIQEKITNLALIKTSYGGHLGFLEGLTTSRAHYMERICEDLMSEICKKF